MTIEEAKEAFLTTWDQVTSLEPGKIKVEEQWTILQIATPGYDFMVYGGDSAAETLAYFLNVLCDYASGKTNINTNNMIWFPTNTHIVLLWEDKGGTTDENN